MFSLHARSATLCFPRFVSAVVAGLVPAVHVSLAEALKKGADAPGERGHDGE
jgi:hypothetical protein